MHLKRLAWLVLLQVTPQSILDGAVEAPEPMRELYAAIDKVSSWALYRQSCSWSSNTLPGAHTAAWAAFVTVHLACNLLPSESMVAYSFALHPATCVQGVLRPSAETVGP